MANLPMSQGDLYLLLPLAWQQYLDNLTTFTDYKPIYTAKTAEDGLKLLKTAQEMPDDQSRGAAAERTRRLLVPQVTEYLDAWLRLDGYIEDAYGDEGYEPMREAAGADFYADAANENWDALTRLIAAARACVAANLDDLLADDNMPPSFPGKLETEAQDVEKLLAAFLAFRTGQLKSTQLKEAANTAALTAWQKVARDADRILRHLPDQLRFFQTDYLLGLVRGTGQAGIRGTVTLPDGTAALGVLVQVMGLKDAIAVTDEDGRYALPVVAGTYTLQFSGLGYQPMEKTGVEIPPGVKKRVDGQVVKG